MSSQQPNIKNIGPNTSLLRRRLTDLGLEFDVDDALDEENPGAPNVTYASFAGTPPSQQWFVFFFTHEEIGLVRCYVNFYQAQSTREANNLLKVANHINYNWLLNANLEFSSPPDYLRIKSYFNAGRNGFPAAEFSAWVKKQIARGGYMSMLFANIAADTDDFDLNSQITNATKKVEETFGYQVDID
ncbi:hypothetical protein [Burkholderia cenocepacia]|uniref:hypothetical protein n=1 Tax=Burkholderia cenocepacia TaxID=95486 RepID=UPI001BA1DD78|nr:hypothetical protein [Burkholderia cenocepacia]MBR8135165.1 hypothetical protein [Burkholderia cenocepacia]